MSTCMGALLISQEVFQSVFCWLLVINIYRQTGISKCVAMEVRSHGALFWETDMTGSHYREIHQRFQ